MIADKDVDEALLFLAENAEAMAHARANAIYTDDMVKHIKGVLIRDRYDNLPISKAEQMALADDRYREALEAKKEAAFQDALMRAKRERASMTIEIYRTQSANKRTPNV